jgi:hypothetical protein
MSAIGRWAGFAVGLADGFAVGLAAGAGETAVGFLAPPGARAAVPAAGTAIPVTGSAAWEGAAPAGAVLAAGVDLSGVGCELLVDAVGAEPDGAADAAGVAVRVGAAWELSADGAVVTLDWLVWLDWPDWLCLLALAVGVAWSVDPCAFSPLGAVLVTGSVTELTTDPRAPVTGSVTASMTPETPDVSPESNDGEPIVAALACVADSDRSRQIPPLAVATCATRRVTRRVLGFDIDHSQSPGNSRLPSGCPAAGHW